MTNPRIVSLLPSATEIVCALGFGDQLVGRSHECDFPARVGDLPILTESKLDCEGLSYEVDARVRAIVQEGLSVYRVLGERLQSLAPDVIVTQAHCEVCAVNVKQVEEAVCEFLGSRPEVVALEPNGLPEVWSGIEDVARAAGAPEKGTALVADLRARMAAVAKVAQAQTSRPSLAYIEWVEPLMAGGNWMPELIEMAGGQNLFGVAGEHSPWITWDELMGADPDVVLVAPCGFDIDRTREDVAVVEDRPEWRDLRAVREGSVYLADGHQYFNRPGPRLVESLEIIAEILHPETFQPRHKGRGWVPSP